MFLNNSLNFTNYNSNYFRNSIDFYVNKCSDLEKDISTAHETHEKDTEEWKKFQADLQTAVRVANDFMNGKLKKFIQIEINQKTYLS